MRCDRQGESAGKQSNGCAVNEPHKVRPSLLGNDVPTQRLPSASSQLRGIVRHNHRRTGRFGKSSAVKRRTHRSRTAKPALIQHLCDLASAVHIDKRMLVARRVFDLREALPEGHAEKAEEQNVVEQPQV